MTGFPIVDTVTPSSGPASGGTPITITGRNFTGTTAVEFDGTPAASFTVVDDNTVTAVTPNFGLAQGWQVDLINAAGSSSPPVVLIDSSGNGNDGIYDRPPDVEFVAGLISEGEAATSVVGQVASVVIDAGAQCSIEYWASASAFEDAIGIGGQGVTDPGQLIVAAAPFSDVTLSGVAGMNIGGPSVPPTPGASFVAIYNSELSLDEEPFPMDGAPHHVVFTFSGSGATGSISLYIDGLLIETQTTPSGIGWALTDPVQLGISAAGAAVIDELAIYPTELSSGDVAANFAAAAVSYDAYGTQVLSLSPTVFYRFDDNRASGFFLTTGGGWHVGNVGVG